MLDIIVFVKPIDGPNSVVAIGEVAQILMELLVSIVAASFMIIFGAIYVLITFRLKKSVKISA